MPENNFDIKGLTNEQVSRAREQFGENKLHFKTENSFVAIVKRTAQEPMVILLLAAATIYFVSGKAGDGLFLTAAVLFQASISLYQFSRSKNALEKLKDLSQPHCDVIRNGARIQIKSEELVIGDSLLVEEGTLITADGSIVHSNDFSVNESVLTGESLTVFKDKYKDDNRIYAGSSVASGLAIATVTAIGNDTKLGKIGSSLEGIAEEKTPLEVQIANFVKKMAVSGALVFVIVWLINYWRTQNILNSLLQSLTLAMSILPEEIPVAFTTFMALGAWRLMKMGIVVKQMKTVETLGSATVICTDKTGTLTENKMSLAQLYVLSTNKIIDASEAAANNEIQLVQTAMWASEPHPFDPMEMALHKAYSAVAQTNERPNYKLVHEYSLAGKPPMMTHVFENSDGKKIIAAKGAPEALLKVSDLTPVQKDQITTALLKLATRGYRLLGVGLSHNESSTYPENQQDLPFEFLGIVAFYDPPKKNIQKVLSDFYTAGIDVKIITGDNTATTVAIAKQIGFRNVEKTITGTELMQLDAAELQTCVHETAIFTRMFPEAKLKIIEALKANKQIVAMTGDGVNDGPALKAAHIGIAMGKKGTEIAKQAASLILLEDDLSKMVDAIAMGRKIYTNLKKAIQYIISIHIPIILTVFIPLALGWLYPNIFAPMHIIFLEIIMGPTCSIIYENEPLEKNAMSQKPKALSSTFFNWHELSVSILQGLIITIGALAIYQFSVACGYNEARTRTLTFTVLIAANIFLTVVNRSAFYSVFTTFRYKNNWVLFIIGVTVSLVTLLLFVPVLTAFFEFERLSYTDLFLCIALAALTVFWFEGVKWQRRVKAQKVKKDSLL
ncbi:cation-translocating P-type ATPase [Flavobacterium aurantiibacter]|uniref:Haloacid dehalogenase n=1 Tax=Flavobacterium aurantiibacter TaxID=2023067 RepID=A0A256A6K3_9FLAO|nr:cation-translocating P-type ATPase [Flavobacterium aurantiibacter]OYQ49209.1 haloacid dehalogenase [Flavobacterium aurantiibacter]